MDDSASLDLDTSALKAAPQISLLRRPATANARQLTERVAQLIQEHSGNTRKIGKKALPRLLDETGIMLGGLLSRSPQWPFVRVQKDPSAAFWKPPSALGGRAFWAKAEALRAAGLIAIHGHINVPTGFGGFVGLATRIQATDGLWRLAASRGCTPETRSDDWPIDPTLPAKIIEVQGQDLVQFWEWPSWVNGRVKHPQHRKRAEPPPYVTRLEDGVKRLNEMAAGLTITGCAPPRFKRVYGPNVALGGRFYATGEGDGYQNIRREERRHIRINGEPIVEIDIKAAALSIYLARHCEKPLPEDPYEVEGFKRKAVKAWVTLSLYQGRLKGRWTDETRPAFGNVPIGALKAAMLARYPTLEQLGQSAPPEAVTDIPDPRLLPWASGQALLAVEAQIVGRALDTVMQKGGIALPLHDALVVPRSAAKLAKGELERACYERLGKNVEVEINHLSLEEDMKP